MDLVPSAKDLRFLQFQRMQDENPYFSDACCDLSAALLKWIGAMRHHGLTPEEAQQQVVDLCERIAQQEDLYAALQLPPEAWDFD